jgi:hypothetical protein
MGCGFGLGRTKLRAEFSLGLHKHFFYFQLILLVVLDQIFHWASLRNFAYGHFGLNPIYGPVDALKISEEFSLGHASFMFMGCAILGTKL